MKYTHGEQTLESMSQAVWYNRWTLNKFKKYLYGDILEVGCGIGNFTKTLTKYGSVWTIDINKEHLTRTKNSVKDKVKIGFGNIEKGEYFFKARKFDSIICLNVLEHIEDDNQAMENIYNLLKIGGFLIILVPTHPILYGEIDRFIGHFRRYIKEEIVDKLKGVGFKILQSRRLNLIGAVGWFIAGRILKQNKVEERNVKIFNLFAPIALSFENIFEPPLGTSILIVAQK